VTLFFASAGWAQIPTEVFQGQEAVAGEVLLRVPTPQALQAIVAQQDIERSRDLGNGLVLLHSRTRSVTEMVGNLRGNGAVRLVEPNYIIHAVTTANDSYFSVMWGLRNTGQTVGGVAGTPGADIHATSAWSISTGSRANIVGIIDTGIDYNHPDLGANIWNAPASFTVVIGGQNITCPAGSHGFNAITNSCNPMDDNGHGTHVAGTIGAIGGNATGVTGINWTASMMGLKFLDSTGSGNTADAIDAINFAVQVKQIFGSAGNVRVLNASWGGGGFSQALLDAIQLANTNEMLFAAAAGNSNSNNDVTPFYPANYNAANMITVASTANRDDRSSFSNYGATTVNIGAPGSTIISTYPGNNYAYLSGTSMATPHVSGAAALVLAACNLTTSALKANLLSHGDPTASMSGITTTGARLDVDSSIRACAGSPTPDFAVSATPVSRSVSAGASVTYIISLAPNGGFTGAVNLSLAGLPAGATGTFNSAVINGGSGISTLTVQTNGSITAGTHPFTVTGTNGSLIRSIPLTLISYANFSMSATPTSNTIAPGTSSTYTVTLARSAGFTSSVAFSVSGLPAGATPTFSPASTTGSTTTLTVAIDAAAANGTYPLTITGIGGGLTRTTSATLIISSADFTISESPTSQTVAQGGSTTYSVTLARGTGFTASIAFSVSGLPAGATPTFSPTSTTGLTATLTVAVDPTAAIGTYPLTITGTGGGFTRTTPVTLIVNGAPDFTMSASPASQTIAQGTSNTYSVTLARGAGFTASVDFSVSGLPAGATPTFSPTSTTGSTATLTVAVDPTAAIGTYPLTITGTGGGITRTTPVTLIVNAAPDFAMSASPTSQTIAKGGSTNSYGVTLTRGSGFTASVAFSVSGLPAGVTPTFSPASTTGSTTTLTVAATSSAAVGTYALTITGTGGGVTRTASVTLIITYANFTISASPASRTIVQGANTSFGVLVTRGAGFTASLAFSVSGMPAGVTSAFSPASTSGSTTTLNITNTAAAAPGSYPLTITATGGGVTRSTSASLVIN